jgi:hypothetical protein
VNAAAPLSDLDEQILELAAANRWDPEGWAEVAYDWGHGELAGVDGPREWQRETMREIRDHLANPATRFEPCLLAVASGHGIGKSADIGMILNWAMSTAEDCKVVVTANTDTQVRTKTAPEVGLWFRRSITAHWFDVQATSIAARDPTHSKSWRLDFIPWSEHNTEAFAGLHNVRKRIVVVFDEASKIADKVWEVTEGALTDEETEIIWIAFGNPTRNTGRFRECFRRLRHRWKHRQIDSRTVPGTNKKQIAAWEQDYGVDSDFFKIRVRGMFPSAGPKQFISTEDVDAAFGRHLRRDQFEHAPKILGVDPAWTGDDELVIYLRQGLYSKRLLTMPKNDNDVFVANRIAALEDEHQVDQVFIDFGYGTGIKSAGDTMGRDWILVNFGSKPGKAGYLNKRAEMWADMRDWLKAGGTIEKDDVLYQDLIGPETLPRLDGAIALESKEDMKKRGVPSPNRADALGLTFAFPVGKKLRQAPGQAGRWGQHSTPDYNPFEHGGNYNAESGDYNPYG